MVQLHILSGRKAASQWPVRRFPFRIGRARENDLQLDDDGAWDRHLTLEFHPRQGVTLVAAPNAMVTVNNQPVETALLNNGDVITLGAAKLQFWLAAVRQRNLYLREGLVWMLLLLVLLCQSALIYWLLGMNRP